MPAADAPILVATDFSTRSDRAMWRATVLAKESGVPLFLVHVIDDDRPLSLIEPQLDGAQAALDGAARSAREIDGVETSASLVQGDVAAGIVAAAEQTQARLIVLGPHRRKLRDSLFGTTAGRTMAHSAHPVLIAASLPSSPYEKILVALDLGEASAEAARRVGELALFAGSQLIALHAFDAPAEGMLKRGMNQPGQVEDYVAAEQIEATDRFRAFLGRNGLVRARQLVVPIRSTPARTIIECAAEQNASLIVVGARQPTGIKRWLLGSVAEQVVEAAEGDVLVIPAR